MSDAGVSWAVEYKRVLDHYDRYGRFAWETFGGRPWREFEREPPAGNCAECDAAVAEAELAYSRQNFGRALCRRDQERSTLDQRELLEHLSNRGGVVEHQDIDDGQAGHAD